MTFVLLFKHEEGGRFKVHIFDDLGMEVEYKQHKGEPTMDRLVNAGVWMNVPRSSNANLGDGRAELTLRRDNVSIRASYIKYGGKRSRRCGCISISWGE
ncbi:hypothetical protein PIB30_014648 [Stylosanthes scabra]|uniref:Uncharacterized protein n=1 Tax=Stylosanthes scabra TaxID=79078 RepID=A0ABU6S696_9FABA|nr:hypothetical protein [Stylosanthes scabra]